MARDPTCLRTRGAGRHASPNSPHIWLSVGLKQTKVVPQTPSCFPASNKRMQRAYKRRVCRKRPAASLLQISGRSGHTNKGCAANTQLLPCFKTNKMQLQQRQTHQGRRTASEITSSLDINTCRDIQLPPGLPFQGGALLVAGFYLN